MLLGRHVGVSIATVLLAVLVATVTALWVGATVGAEQLAEWTVSTWRGEPSHGVVLASVAALVALGAVVAALNSGVLPTFVLVASPLFGTGLARVGAEYTVAGTTYTVSFGDAVADAAGAAILIGAPLAVVGFLLGEIARRTMRGRFGGAGSSLSAQ